MFLTDDDLEISIKWFSRAKCFLFVAINHKISKVILIDLFVDNFPPTLLRYN